MDLSHLHTISIWRIKLPVFGRAVHPSVNPNAPLSGPLQAENVPPSKLERCRDQTLSFLTHSLLSIWTLLLVAHTLLVIGWGAAWFFLAVTDDATKLHYWLDVSIQWLTALFTFSMVLQLPWRLANVHHLWFSHRRQGAGLGFYGQPTESIWFHVPLGHRKIIVALAFMNTVCQIYAQIARILYSTYNSTVYPAAGYFHTEISFMLALGTGVIATSYQIWVERKVQSIEPERFPAGPVEEVARLLRSYRRGLWCFIPDPCPQTTHSVCNWLLATVFAKCFCKLVALLIALPWLVGDAVQRCAACCGFCDAVPLNPTEGPCIRIIHALTPPRTSSDLYVAVSVSADGGTKYTHVARTRPVPYSSTATEWKEAVHLGVEAWGWGPKAKLKFLLREEQRLGLARASTYIGHVITELKELESAQGENELLLQETDGDPVLSGYPLKPCFLVCSFGPEALNQMRTARSARVGPSLLDTLSVRMLVEQPSSTVGGDTNFPAHVFLMSRGTRGDVQPFVALARGLCNELGWLVTICTESRWKEFVISKCNDITNGAVRFVCCGGDTQLQTESWISKEIMSAKAEALQAFMMALSESNFFASAPVCLGHLKRLQASSQPVDLIINAFTLTGVALMCGEACGVPVAGFCLQPSAIPSKDKHWAAVVAIDGGGLPLIEKAEAALFTSHSSLRPCRACFEGLPWSGLSLPKLRRQHNLPPSITWRAAFKWRLPIVIPMRSDSFERPSDWPDSFTTTDFIFLRSAAAVGGSKNGLELPIARFIDEARTAGRKLMVMTFSSMPVARATALDAAVKMLKGSKHDFALLYVGANQKAAVPTSIMGAAEELVAAGKLLEAERADFGVLFQHMDAFVVHGGLGTTVEALRMRKPVCVTGILLLDQRFWGQVCYDKGVGPMPVHIDAFKGVAVEWADKALDPNSEYVQAAAALEFGDEAEDGVSANVRAFARLVSRKLPPPPSHVASKAPPRRSAVETTFNTVPSIIGRRVAPESSMAAMDGARVLEPTGRRSRVDAV